MSFFRFIFLAMPSQSNERIAFYQELEARINSIVTQSEFALDDSRLEPPEMSSRCLPICREKHIRFCPPSCRSGEKPCPGPWRSKNEAPGSVMSSFD
jgi:hypothetical protein